jgi:hypothetical protein
MTDRPMNQLAELGTPDDRVTAETVEGHLRNCLSLLSHADNDCWIPRPPDDPKWEERMRRIIPAIAAARSRVRAALTLLEAQP